MNLQGKYGALIALGILLQGGAFGFAALPPRERSWALIIFLLAAGLAAGTWGLLRSLHDPAANVSISDSTDTTALTGLAVGRFGFRWQDVSLLVAFGLFLPVLGLVGLTLTLFVRARSGPRKRRSGIVETDAPALAGGPLTSDQAGRFGPGSLEGILRHSPNQDLRLRVVLACRQLPGRLAVPLLRLALRDRVDDVRLLAYAVLDGRERDIQTEIQSTLKGARINDPETANVPTDVRCKLAELYWELVYQGLVEGELLSFCLDQVQTQAHAVLKVDRGRPRMALIAGRASIMRRRFDQARPMLEEALRRGLSMAVVGPYLAEIEYELRRPDEVRRYVAGFAESARLRPALASIVERWS
jgi:hypothetical protein